MRHRMMLLKGFNYIGSLHRLGQTPLRLENRGIDNVRLGGYWISRSTIFLDILSTNIYFQALCKPF